MYDVGGNIGIILYDQIEYSIMDIIIDAWIISSGYISSFIWSISF